MKFPIKDNTNKILKENREIVDEENYKMLYKFSILILIMMLVITVASCFVFFIKPYTIGFSIFDVVYLINLCLVYFVCKKNKQLTNYNYYFLYIITFLYSLYMGAYMNRHGNAGIVLVLLVAFPMTFLESYRRLGIVTALMAVCFSIFSVWLKNPTAYVADICNLLCGIIISFFVDRAMTKIRIENILGKNALRNDSYTDALTGLPNRRSFNDYMANLSHGIKQKSDITVYVFMADIDDFKLYNDYYGHLQGDDCLKLIAGDLMKTAKQHNLLFFRFGGEEFVGVSINNALELDHIAKEVVESVGRLQIEHKNAPGHIVTISAGCVTNCEMVTDDYMELVRLADEALYMAKESGKNKYQIYNCKS